MDEMAEFPRSVMEALRQPLEDGKMVVSRSMGRVEYPAKFMLVGAVNPCPCGYLGHPTIECKCTNRQVDKYKQRLSGPIVDRMDLQVEVASLRADEFSKPTIGQKSEKIRQMVIEARVIQERRFRGTGMYCNAQMINKQVREHCHLSSDVEHLLELAVDKYQISARGYFRLIKVARTIADLDGKSEINVNHVAEVLQFRDKVF